MPITYLNVEHAHRAAAKALGASWDAEARKWFVPGRRGLAPFDAWLKPEQRSTDVAVAESGVGAVQEQRRGKSLSRLLESVAHAVERTFRQGEWTVVDVVQVTARQHVFLELAERDTNGVVLAEASATIWASTAQQVLPPFEAACWRRCRFEPVSDRRLSHRNRTATRAVLRCLPRLAGSRKSRHVAQIGIGTNTDPTLTAITSDEALEQQLQRLQERSQREGVFDRPPPTASMPSNVIAFPWWRRRRTLVAMAASVLLAAIVVPQLTSSPDYPEPPTMLGGDGFQQLRMVEPRHAAEQLVARLRQVNLRPGLFQRGKVYVVDITLMSAELPAAEAAFSEIRLKPTAGFNRVEFIGP